MVALLLSSCDPTPQIPDFEFCSPFPGGLGAACSTFLSSKSQTLSEEEWNVLQEMWVSSGQAIECTTSGSVAAIKRAIEQLCSVQPCNEKTRQDIVKGLSAMESLAPKISSNNR